MNTPRGPPHRGGGGPPSLPLAPTLSEGEAMTRSQLPRCHVFTMREPCVAGLTFALVTFASDCPPSSSPLISVCRLLLQCSFIKAYHLGNMSSLIGRCLSFLYLTFLSYLLAFVPESLGLWNEMLISSRLR